MPAVGGGAPWQVADMLATPSQDGVDEGD